MYKYIWPRDIGRRDGARSQSRELGGEAATAPAGVPIDRGGLYQGGYINYCYAVVYITQ